MTGRYEPVLHALSIEPRSARPGETIHVQFRARNLGALPSPPATVVFALPAGLEALAATEVAVEPAAPGEHVAATLLARVGPPLDDRSELAVQAALRLPGAELGTNVCALEVRSRPVLDGPASGTFVAALGGDVVRVRAVVANEGDGPARGVRLVVPAPLGCVRCDGDGPATLRCERLEAGESVTLDFEARVVAPLDEIRADEGVIWIGDRAHCVLPVREGFVPEPVVAPPSVQLQVSRRRVDLSVGVRNEGWADARDLSVRLTLPTGLKLFDGSVAVDGVPAVSRAAPKRGKAAPFARLVRSGQTCTIVLASLPAHSGVRIAMAATHPAGWHGGTIVLTAGSHEETVSCVVEPAPDVRASLAGLPRSVSPGEVVRFLARIVNAGDVPETLRLTATGTSTTGSEVPGETRTATRMLAPGFVVSVTMTVHVADDVTDNELRLGVVVSDADGERARAEQTVAVRRQVSIAPEEPTAFPPSRQHVAAVRASLAAPSEVIAGAPFGLRVEVHVDEDVDALIIRVPAVAGVTYVAGSTTLDGCALLDRFGRSPLDEGLVLRAVRAGTRITVAWSCVADAVASEDPLSIAVGAEADGVTNALLAAEIRVCPCDSFAMRPTGLRYHVEACAATASVPDAPASPVMLEAATAETEDTVADSPVSAAHSPVSGLQGGDAPGIACHEFAEVGSVRVGADTGAAEDHAPTSRSRDDAFSFTMRLDPDRVERIERLAGGTRSGGLVAHVLAIGALLPDGVIRPESDGIARPESDDIAGLESDGHASFARVQLALDDVRRALEDVCDRLFVKLRIPGFYVAADDLEDPALRRALTDLFVRLQATLDRQSPAARCGVIDSARVAGTCALLVEAPYGAPTVLRALVALISSAQAGNELADSAEGPSFAGALERWAQRLDTVLARYEGVPLELFDDALANGSDVALDDARDALLRALRADLIPRQLAC